MPEPGTLGLIFAGLAALAARRRRAGTREHEQQ
ncbi:MAG: PEP-CTERM sorting domain-containing protein [Armatimonadota bacterium]